MQWVSVHTGKPSKIHKVYRTGQKLNSSFKQLWDIFSINKINSSIWGAFNSSLKNKKNIDLFFPDPWSHLEKTFPQNYNTYSKLPSYYAQNYPSIKKTKIIYFGFLFLIKILFSNIFFYLIKNFINFFKIFKLSGLKSINLYFFLDLMSLLILKNHLKKKKSEFVIIALNSFAHYQHNYWDEKKYEPVYFWYLNEMVKVFNDIENLYNSSIVFNGFSQKKIKNEYYPRPKDPKMFLDILKIKYLKIHPNMTTGATIYFKNFSDKLEALKRFRKFNIYKYPIFEVEDYKNKKKFFYKFSIVGYKNEIILSSINLKNYKNYFKKPRKLFKKYKNEITEKSTVDLIFKNIIFMKSTSKHTSNGILFYRNFDFMKKDKLNKKIINTKIYANILRHFKL